jgi:NAD(P)-dependent dehydrogenase (short-subunit alcohol dehydrogenase family)
MNPLDLSGSTVLVTGASSGIGRETAVLLSELGARVIASGRSEDKLLATRQALHGSGHATVPFDLSSLEQIPQWMRDVTKQHGPLDGLVHSAGTRVSIGLRSLSLEQLETTLRVNLSSAVMLTKGFRQKGCHAGGGSIVLLSSVAGMCGAPGIAAYAASKAGLIGFCKASAIELAKEQIRVNCIAPGIVESEMLAEIRETLLPEQYDSIVAQHPLGIGTARDVAHAAAYLLSGASRWMTGAVLVLDGGYSAQ